MSKIKIVTEYISFLKKRKRHWLIPLFVLMFAIGLLLVFAETSALAPFIYTMF